MASNGKLQPFEVRCVSTDRFSTPVVHVTDSVEAATLYKLWYHEETKISLNRLGVFDVDAGTWVKGEMPKDLYGR